MANVPKILICDDDVASALVLRKGLAIKGFETHSVATGQECLNFVSDNPADLLLLDRNMPDVSGQQVLASVRENHDSFSLPVIMVTGDIVSALKAGANDYITKPIKLDITEARFATQLKLKELAINSMLKQELETVNSMIITYNHELNNPLMVALGTMSMLKRGKTDMFDQLEKALNRMATILKKVKLLTGQPLEKSTYVGDSKMYKIEID